MRMLMSEHVLMKMKVDGWVVLGNLVYVSFYLSVEG